MTDKEPGGCLCFLRFGDKAAVVPNRTTAIAKPEAERSVKPAASPAQPQTAHGAAEAHPGALLTLPPKSGLHPTLICPFAENADATDSAPPLAVPGPQPSPAAALVPALLNTSIQSTEVDGLKPSNALTTDDAPGKLTDTGHQPAALCALSRSSSASTAFFSVAGWSDFGDSEGLIPTPRQRTNSMKFSDDDTHGGRLTASKLGPSKSMDRTHGSTSSAPLGDALAIATGSGPPPPPPSAGAWVATDTATTSAAASAAHQALPTIASMTQEPLPASDTTLPLPSIDRVSQDNADPPAHQEHNGLQRQQQRQQDAATVGTDTQPAATTAASTSTAQGPAVVQNGAANTRAAMLDRVADLYGTQGQPCKACQVLLQLCKTHGDKPESLQQELRARQLPDATGLTRIVQGVSECLRDIASDDSGWHVVRNDELRLLYKHMSGPGVHAFRARCTLDAPLEHLLAVAREVDLYPTWNKYCTSAHVLQERSVTDVTVYMSIWMPWPFVGVGFLLEAAGADLFEEEGRLVVTFNSPDQEEPGIELPHGADKHRRVRLLPPSCLTFRPLPPTAPGGPQRTECCVQAYVDPGMRHVPGFIIAFVLKVFSPFMFNTVKKVLASAFAASNPLPTRIRQRRELYELVRKRTVEYLKRMEGQGSQGPAAKPLTADGGASGKRR